MIALKKLPPHWPEAAVALLVIIACMPAFTTPGFLFFLDWTWAPTLHPIAIDNTNLLSGLPLQILSHILAAVLPTDVIQKILLAATLALLGTGAISLARSILSFRILHFSMQATLLSVGIFAIFNPFTISRVSLGHLHLLLGCAATFWALAMLIRALEHPAKKRLKTAGIVLVFPLLVSIHHAVLLPLAVAPLLFRKKQYRRSLRSHAPLLIVPSALCIIALVIAGYAHDAWVGHRIVAERSPAFELRYPCTATPIDIAILTASWRPLPAACPDTIPSALGWAAIIAIILYGTTELWALALACIAILLAYFTKDIVHAIPAWATMRDSGKFISLLVIAESTLIAAGVSRFYRIFPNFIMPLIAFLAVCSISLPLFSAFSDIITPRQYPQSWTDFARTLREMPGAQTILFFPQTTYATFQFAGNTPIANPAPGFFSGEQIIGKTAQSLSLDYATLEQEQIAYVALASSDPRAGEIRKTIQTMPHLKQLIEDADLSVWQFIP